MTQNPMCSVFNCDHKHGNHCCAHCDVYHKCKSHCLNDPDKCGLSVEKTRKTTYIVRAEVEK